MKQIMRLAPIIALTATGLGIGTNGTAAATEFETFEVSSWTCAGDANGVWSANCHAVADYFCRQKGFDSAVTFRFSATNGKVSRYSRIACAR
jgi:hypothetical protein